MAADDATPATSAGLTDALLDAGVGQPHSRLTLGRTTTLWLAAGERLRLRVAEVLAGRCTAVEQIGSSAVLGLLAKPIVDLAVATEPDSDLAPVQRLLEDDGWIYRGDAGASGGHVFVLESAPEVRVAHLHAVVQDDEQWRRYLALRDLLRGSAEARSRYEAVKLRLVAEVGDDRAAYTEGKTDVVLALLASTDG